MTLRFREPIVAAVPWGDRGDNTWPPTARVTVVTARMPP